MFRKLPHPGRDIIHSAVESPDPQPPFVVFDYGIHELVGEGGGFASVVCIEFPLPGEGVNAQQAVVAAHQKTPVRILQDGVDMVEPFAVRHLAGHRGGCKIGAVEAAVPGSEPQHSVTILRNGADARGRAIFIGEAGGGKGSGGKVEHQQPLARSLAADPEAAVVAHEEILYENAWEIVRQPPAVVAVEPVAECSQPDGAAPILHNGGDNCLRQDVQRAEVAAVVAVCAVVGADPQLPAAGLHKSVDIAAAAFAQLMPDHLLAVEAVEPLRRAYPDDADGVLQQCAHRV